MSRSAFRRRVAPSVPLLIEYEDEQGKFSKLYRLAFNLNVLAEISEKTGLQALTFDLWTNISAQVLRVMFWAALLPHQPEFASAEGLEAAGAMLDGASQDACVRALWEAYLLYLPKDQADVVRKMREEASEESRPSMSPEAAAPAEQLPGSSSGVSADTISESPKAKSVD
jgi:hypothetical protein